MIKNIKVQSLLLTVLVILSLITKVQSETSSFIENTPNENQKTTKNKSKIGGLPAERAQRITADLDLQAQIESIELLPGPQGEQGIQGVPGPIGMGQTINLTIDPLQFPGIVAQDFNALFPDSFLNTASIEIAGVCQDEVIIINGPAVEIQIVEGFDGQGRPFDQSGFSQALPLVFEVKPLDPINNIGACANLATFFDNYLAGNEVTKPISLIVDNTQGNEVFRWSFFGFEPFSYAGGSEGQRFTFKHPLIQNNRLAIELDGTEPANEQSFKPETDKLVEIAGVGFGFPAIIEETDRRLTLEYDYGEGNGIFNWVEEISQNGTTSFGKLAISLITMQIIDGDLEEVTRTIYFGCFPVKYEQFRGFSQDLQTKERVIVNCDFSERGE